MKRSTYLGGPIFFPEQLNFFEHEHIKSSSNQAIRYQLVFPTYFFIVYKFHFLQKAIIPRVNHFFFLPSYEEDGSYYATEIHNTTESPGSKGAPTAVKSLDEKKMRRQIANSNERRRMQSINAGFQSLRQLLPHHEGEKLSKVSD